MRDEIEDARQRKDLTRLTALFEELQGPWRSPPPPDLAQQVRELLTRQATTQGRLLLRGLTDQLQAALGARDEVQAEQLLNQWQQLATQLQLPTSDSLARQVVPVREWLEPPAAAAVKRRQPTRWRGMPWSEACGSSRNRRRRVAGSVQHRGDEQRRSAGTPPSNSTTSAWLANRRWPRAANAVSWCSPSPSGSSLWLAF